MTRLSRRCRLGLDGLGTDFRLAVRGLVRARGFTLVTLASLALGMGANTALFSLVDATALRPVPGVGQPDRIVELLITVRGRRVAEWANPDLEDLRSAKTPLQMVAGWKIREGTLAVANTAQRVRVMYASSGYFPTLGVRVARGRFFRPPEDAGPGQHPVAVLSHELWQSTLGGRADVLDTLVTLDRVSYQVVGVAPERFRHHRVGEPAPDLWVPLTQHPLMAGPAEWATDREARWVEALGRLQPGATVQEANAAVATVAARLAKAFPESNRERGAVAAPFGPLRAINDAGMVAIAGVLAGGALVLLIICTNLAGLMLARGAARQRDLAVRAALGAGRGRLARAVLVEAAVLAIGGAAIGSAAAWGGMRLAAATGFLGPLEPDLSLDLRVLVFSCLLVLATALAIGVLPAVRLTRPKAIGSLRDEIGAGGYRAGRLHRIAVTAQVAVAVVFVAVSALFARSLSQLEGRDLGFDPARLLVVSLDLTAEGYDAARGRAFTERLREVVAGLPDVRSAAVADGLPIDLVGNFISATRADADHAEAGGVQAEFTAVGPGFFEAVGMRVLRGRSIERTDTAGSPRVVVITRGLAERFWPGEAALGRQVRLRFSRDRGAAVHTVIGVTPDVASSRPTEDWPQVFVPLTQHEDRMRLRLLVRARSDAAALAKPVQAVVRSIDPLFAVPPAFTSAELVALSLEGQRATAIGAGGMGLAGLLLSAFGIYGLVAFVVSQRTREFGLRMALGAGRGRVLRTVLADVGLLAAPGLGVGLLAASGFAAAVRSMLLGVGPLNPVALGLTVLVVLAVVLAAAAGPAARAARVDPSVALRAE